jgi:hypothetical protein
MKIIRQGRIAKLEAMARVETNAKEEWKDAACRAVAHLCKDRDYITSEDVWRVLKSWQIPPPREPRAMGPVLTKMVARKVIEPTGNYRQSSLPQQNARPLMIYKVKA